MTRETKNVYFWIEIAPVLITYDRRKASHTPRLESIREENNEGCEDDTQHQLQGQN